MLAFLLPVGKNLHLAIEDVSLLERKIDVSSGASLEGVTSDRLPSYFYFLLHIPTFLQLEVAL